MHRTQIYFDEPLFEALKKRANDLDVSLSAYIREVLKENLEQQPKSSEKPDFSAFSGMWRDRELTQESLRAKAWKK